MSQQVSAVADQWRDIIFAKGEKSEIGQRLGIQYTKAMEPTISVSYGDLTIQFHQESMGLMAISGVVWDAGLLMADYLLWAKDSDPSIITGLLLDIGCGTGIAGISALVLGENHVLFTDIDRLACFDYNVEQLTEYQQCRQIFVKYVWNEVSLPVSFLSQSVGVESSKQLVSTTDENNTTEQDVIVWDTLLCSDLLYEEKSHSLLLSVMRRLRFKRAVFTYKKRHEEPEEKFFESLSEWCSIEVVDADTIPLVNLPRTSLSGLYVVIVKPLLAL